MKHQLSILHIGSLLWCWTEFLEELMEKVLKLGWIPIIYFVATQGTIFNWTSIVSNSLSSCISAVLGGVSQKKSEFYMSSILIDCILCTQPFPSLKFHWDKDRAPVYAAYKLFWAHKYYSYYKEICENFIMPLYTLIFLFKCNCMSEGALKVVQEYRSYYLKEEGLYLRMYGSSRAPSLLPRYATDYVLHKKAIRQLYIDGVGNFLLNRKRKYIL